ncbi:SapC family protein [Qipengyuania atrilutea]|uniref:SapC family protein n=1 Tax=Qipengyuania atrilutea TaxID=2744473 RepID=A0A850H339_9SPHN|nr:SapC family protein [Actirhodobacter atriluteus]NVD45086.1 SapC family protein [Actirhodobacter atriluteus]
MRTAVLDNIAHADLRLRRESGPDFGDAVGQVAVFLPELPQVQREYPILFSRDQDGSASPIALTGLQPDELLFASGAGWDADYIPAAARKGPFLLGKGESDDPVIHVVLDHPKITEDAENADPIFLPHGGHALALENALDALRLIHSGMEPTRRMAAAFDDAKLIQPLSFNVQVSETQAVKFDNFHAILPEAIDALSSGALTKLSAAGFLQPAVLIAHSLGNINRLIQRKRKRGA